MKHKIAVLSNVNMNFVLRMLKKDFDVYNTEGYGNELGLLLDQNSSYHQFAPEVTFLIMDLMEVLEHDLNLESDPYVERWFSAFEAAIEDNGTYYVSDAYLWGPEAELLFTPLQRQRLEMLWNIRLQQTCEKYKNVRVFSYRRLIEKIGEGNSFSLKTWYMGKIPHTNEMQKAIHDKITHYLELESRVAKKVLLLDLDNTLWGGIAGENDHTPIVLSDDHAGLAYKNLQRVIAQMQRSGVILGIVSKNNEEDALAILENHPHMLLRKDAFSVMKINWELKSENILRIAEELNLGVDSFVFFDDNPTEREMIRQMLPDVTVPEFPRKPEDLAGAMCDIYHTYFEKAVITHEDLSKVRQYADNAKRNALQKQTVSFEDYLKQLKIKVKRVDAGENTDRLHQLVNKTNQFNLTTKRYELAEIKSVIADPAKKVYFYNIEDCFGDYGMVAAVIVDTSQEKPVIEEFVLSCRVMGKNVEYGIVQAIEDDLLEAGYQSLRGTYLPTDRNKPVENLYERLGYTVTAEKESGAKEYVIDMLNRPERAFYAEFL